MLEFLVEIEEDESQHFRAAMAEAGLHEDSRRDPEWLAELGHELGPGKMTLHVRADAEEAIHQAVDELAHRKGSKWPTGAPIVFVLGNREPRSYTAG